MSRLSAHRCVAPVFCLLMFWGGAVNGVSPSSRFAVGQFSVLQPGGGFGTWRVNELPSVKPARFAVVSDGDTRVVSISAAAAASSLATETAWDVDQKPRLTWRWKVDRVVSSGDIRTKEGDDFAARLYVMFDYPLDQLSFADRAKLRVARWLYGDQVPTAALCYVWGNAESAGTEAWSAYTDRVRLIVLRNRDDAVGDWVTEQRNIAADFRRAFGDVTAPVTGLAIAADTDQTGESVRTWFGDIHADR
jgi:hypothetical protein